MLTSIRSKTATIALLALVLPAVAIGVLASTASAVAAGTGNPVAAASDGVAGPQFALPVLKAILHQNMAGGAVTVAGENFLPNQNVELYALFRDNSTVWL